jgi:hypothetical protein
MVDYVSVLRRTLDALPKNTPEIRERVYGRARQTVRSKLELINPPPSQALVDKQLSALEAAIATVESDYAVATEAETTPAQQTAEPAPKFTPAAVTPAAGPLDDIFRKADAAPKIAVGDTQVELPKMPQAPTLDVSGTDAVTANFRTGVSALPESVRAESLRVPNDPFSDVFSTDGAKASDPLDGPVVPPTFAKPVKSKSGGGWLMPVVLLAALGGGGYAAWTQREAITDAVGPLIGLDTPANTTPDVATAPETPAATPSEQPAQPATETPVAEATPPAAETPVQPADPAATAPQKFTQRLNADGSESDEPLPATANGEQSVAQLAAPAEAPAGEAPVAEPPAAEAPVAEAPPAEAPAAETPVAETPPAATPAAEGAIPVGQKAIFYEERTSAADGSAQTGAVVWSAVRESPGNDRPPEPAIRGDLTIPDLGIVVTITIRRNADTTLPASHIMELVTAVPDGFAGGSIDQVQRVNFKPSEENAGSSLSAVPVKVADNYFLVAMDNASPDSIERNLQLMRDQDWIDIPVVYRTGRRALFTMEKGLIGDTVFKEVLDAWAAAPAN